MDICSSFAQLLQVFSVAMTEPTAANFRQLVVGWIFAPRRTITGMLRAGGIDRHHSAYHRLMLAMLQRLHGHDGQQTLHFLGDSA